MTKQQRFRQAEFNNQPGVLPEQRLMYLCLNSLFLAANKLDLYVGYRSKRQQFWV